MVLGRAGDENVLRLLLGRTVGGGVEAGVTRPGEPVYGTRSGWGRSNTIQQSCRDIHGYRAEAHSIEPARAPDVTGTTACAVRQVDDVTNAGLMIVS